MAIAQSIGSLGDLISDSFTAVLNFLNPESEGFFLKVAFVPSDNFMDDFTGDIKAAADNKFTFLSQFRDTWDSVRNMSEISEWEGITYNNPLIGEVVIVSPIALNAWGQKIKFWASGSMILLTVVLTFRRIGGVIGGKMQ